MIVLAVIPFLPLALLFGGGGFFAWLALRKKKEEPQKDGDKEIGGDVPETVTPELTVKGGRTSARLYRNGDVWAFVVDGPRPVTATDKDAGKAAVDMAQSFASSIAGEPDVPITGLATSAERTVAFSVEPRNGRWDWSVTSVSEQPTAPELLAAGEESSRSRGVLQVLSSLTSLIDWLNVPAFEGSTAPPPAPGIARLPGIVVTGNTLAVTSLPAWIAYAAPFVREHLAEGHSADRMMDDEIAGGEDLPPETKLSGKPIAEVRSAVQKIVNEADDEAYLGAAPIDERIAALMVGADLKPDWTVERYKDYVVLVKPAIAPAAAGGGFGLNPGSVWQYLIWEGTQRGYDERALVTKQLPAGKKKGDALKAAKKRIDDEFKEFDDGGNDSATVNPDWNDEPDAGGWDPAPVEPMTVGKSLSLKLAASWTTDLTKDIVLFEVTDKTNRRDWTLDFGLCLTPDSEKPFGSLSDQREDTVNVNYLRFQIRQAPPQNAIGGVGIPLDADAWADFDLPLTWKTQERIKFRRVPHTDGLRLTAPQKDIEDEIAAAVDPCPDKNERWPLPDRPEGFVVESSTGGWTSWLPVPRLQVLVQGKKVILRVRFRGLPVFVDREGGTSPAMSGALYNTKFKLKLKVKATGVNAA